jgi:hypothetical protein
VEPGDVQREFDDIELPRLVDSLWEDEGPGGLFHLRIHDLRHQYASFLVNSGRTLYEVQQIIGHSDHSEMQRYAYLSKKSLQDAADSANEFISNALRVVGVGSGEVASGARAPHLRHEGQSTRPEPVLLLTPLLGCSAPPLAHAGNCIRLIRITTWPNGVLLNSSNVMRFQIPGDAHYSTRARADQWSKQRIMKEATMYKISIALMVIYFLGDTDLQYLAWLGNLKIDVAAAALSLVSMPWIAKQLDS